MFSRWGAIALAGAYFVVFEESLWVWALALLYFFGVPQLCYQVYRRTDSERAEVVFYNERDGYCADSNDGSDDGDGGD